MNQVEDMTTNNALFHRRQIMTMFQFHSWKRRHEIEHKKLKQKIAQKGDTKFTSNMPKLLEARSTIYCNVLKKSWIISRAQLPSTSVSSMLCSYRSKRLTQPA